VSHFVSIRSLRPLPCVAMAFAVIAHAAPATAQTQNPNVVAFLPSPQHHGTLTNGQPAVSRYDLSFYRAGTTERILAVDLGKPAPQADGMIRVDYTSRVASWPLPGVQVVALVTAIGPGGSGASDPSNTFVYDCRYSLSGSGQSVASGGGTGMVEVAAGTLCGWSASSNASWVTVTQGTNGVATGWVNYTVAPNSASATRTAALTIAGLPYTITQAGTQGQANTPPSVTIIRPSDGSTTKLGPLRITANASDADGIAKVEFYADGTLIGTVRKGSYSIRWNVASRGTLTLTAVAQDTRGARTTSAPVRVTAR
jgi:hypothetical protein